MLLLGTSPEYKTIRHRVFTPMSAHSTVISALPFLIFVQFFVQIPGQNAGTCTCMFRSGHFQCFVGDLVQIFVQICGQNAAM